MTRMDRTTAVPNPEPSLARRASVGMLWVSLALVFAKSLSFISQIVLGHVLSVETYAVFGFSLAAVSLIAGFQNASISKALIQNHARFDTLFPLYSAFAFQFGLLGAVLLVGIGAVFQQVYMTPLLFPVLCLTSLSVPLLAVNTTLVASLSVNYRFREINLNDIIRSLIYYSVLVGVALLGAGVFTMAIAAVVGAFSAHLLLRRASGLRPMYFQLRLREFAENFVTLRWILLSGFLLAFALRSDYLVLGKLLPVEAFGFYTFGFMLVSSLTIPISAGINQVLLPILARLQSEPELLREEVVRFSSAIVIIGSALCLLILGLGSVFIRLLWDGKWDGAQFVVLALIAVMPFRFLATISGVGLESIGRWRWRNLILIGEALFLALCALIGASLGGIHGSILGVVFQRALSGIFGFTFFTRLIGGTYREIVIVMTRLYTPFILTSILLLSMSPNRHGLDASFTSISISGLETLVALILFVALTFIINGSFARVAFSLIRKKFSR